MNEKSNADPRPYFIYHLIVNGEEKWAFGTTDDIAVSKFKIKKEKVK